MAENVSDKMGKGISPEQFVEGMTKNREPFQVWTEQFAWADEADKLFFRSLQFRDDLRCLIIAADWCGDVVRNVPVVFHVMKEAGIPTEVFVMEEHTDLMDRYLTMGGRAIPIVIIADTGGFVLGKWGPRPAHVQAVMTAFKQQNPDREASDYNEKLQAARAEMGRQYGEGTAYQQAIVRELKELLAGV